jgi:hypothetical protein
MSDSTFPFKFRISAFALRELIECEFGSYEDHIEWQRGADGKREPPYDDGRLHCVEICERYKTQIVMNDQWELDEVFRQACTGTWSIYCNGTAQRLYDTLRPLASERAQRDTWRPTGM